MIDIGFFETIFFSANSLFIMLLYDTEILIIFSRNFSCLDDCPRKYLIFLFFVKLNEKPHSKAIILFSVIFNDMIY